MLYRPSGIKQKPTAAAGAEDGTEERGESGSRKLIDKIDEAGEEEEGEGEGEGEHEGREGGAVVGGGGGGGPGSDADGDEGGNAADGSGDGRSGSGSGSTKTRTTGEDVSLYCKPFSSLTRESRKASQN